MLVENSINAFFRGELGLELNKRPRVWTVFVRSCVLEVGNHKQWFKAKEECVRVGPRNASGQSKRLRDAAQPAMQEQKPVPMAGDR